MDSLKSCADETLCTSSIQSLYESHSCINIKKFCDPAMHPDVVWVLTRQGLATLFATMVAGLWGGESAAISAFIGGGIGVCGAFAYVWRAMRDGEADPAKLHRAQMLGETYKLAVVLGGFALVFKGYREVAALPLFLSFALTVVVYWIALLKTRN